MCDYAKQEIHDIAAQKPDELDPKALFEFVFEAIVSRHPECADCNTESMYRIVDMIALNRIYAAARQAIAIGKALTVKTYKYALCRYAQKYLPSFGFFKPDAVTCLLGEWAERDGPPEVKLSLQKAGLSPVNFLEQTAWASG